MENYIELLVKNNEWCVKGINPDHSLTLSKYDFELSNAIVKKFKNSINIGFTTFNYYYDPSIDNKLLWTINKPISKTLISFQEFKKYVLEMDEEDISIKENYSFLKEILTNLSIT